MQSWHISATVEPRYNEVLGTMKITMLYQVSHYIRVKKQRTIKSWDQQNYLVIRGFVISDLFITRFHCIKKKKKKKFLFSLQNHLFPGSQLLMPCLFGYKISVIRIENTHSTSVHLRYHCLCSLSFKFIVAIL